MTLTLGKKFSRISWLTQIFACYIVLLSWQANAVLSSGNLVQNGDFGYWPTGMGPAYWTWTINIGASGHGGEIYGTASQQLATVPGLSYELRFSLAGNPNYSGSETLNVYWENHSLGSVTWQPNGQGYQDLGWIECSFPLEASMSPSLLTFENANSSIGGAIPFLTNVSVEPVPEPSTLLLAGLGTCLLCGRVGWLRVTSGKPSQR